MLFFFCHLKKNKTGELTILLSLVPINVTKFSFGILLLLLLLF